MNIINDCKINASCNNYRLLWSNRFSHLMTYVCTPFLTSCHLLLLLSYTSMVGCLPNMGALIWNGIALFVQPETCLIGWLSRFIDHHVSLPHSFPQAAMCYSWQCFCMHSCMCVNVIVITTCKCTLSKGEPCIAGLLIPSSSMFVVATTNRLIPSALQESIWEL